MGKYDIRTDLAVEMREIQEKYKNISKPDDGYKVEEITESQDIKVIKVIIYDENGVKTLGKSKGTYITIEAKKMSQPDEDSNRDISYVIAKYVKELLPDKDSVKALVVGLGNRNATPDALGPRVIDNLLITRNVFESSENYKRNNEINKEGKCENVKNKNGRYEDGKYEDKKYEDKKYEEGKCKEGKYEDKKCAEEKWENQYSRAEVSGIAPGVMAQTGMESVEIVKGIVDNVKPEVVIAVDALAARNTMRLAATVQISNAGINPGSGVGNHRMGITEETIGIPVIAIGIPTVVDAATIVNDTFENLIDILEYSEKLKPIAKTLKGFSSREKHQLVREILTEEIGMMYVTPKDIDETIKCISFTVSEALNILFSENIY